MTPTVDEAHATVSVNGDAVASGVSATRSLHVGANTITVLVTAQDNTTTHAYTLTVTRAAAPPTPTPEPTPTPTPTPTPAKPLAPTVTVPTLPAAGLVLHAGSRDSRASVNVQMSAPGTVSATVEQYAHGRWVKKGTQTLNASHAGPVRLTLGASISGRALLAGRYRVLLGASANGQTSQAVSLPLTVALPANGPQGQPRTVSVTLAPRTIVWTAGHAPQLWLSYVLSRAATLHATLDARVGGIWQQVAGFAGHSAAGAARVQLVGHWNGRLFPARTVRLQASATAAGTSSATQTFTVTVRHG